MSQLKSLSIINNMFINSYGSSREYKFSSYFDLKISKKNNFLFAFLIKLENKRLYKHEVTYMHCNRLTESNERELNLYKSFHS